MEVSASQDRHEAPRTSLGRPPRPRPRPAAAQGAPRTATLDGPPRAAPTNREHASVMDPIALIVLAFWLANRFRIRRLRERALG
jgi:hypothetical protein